MILNHIIPYQINIIYMYDIYACIHIYMIIYQISDVYIYIIIYNKTHIYIYIYKNKKKKKTNNKNSHNIYASPLKIYLFELTGGCHISTIYQRVAITYNG